MMTFRATIAALVLMALPVTAIAAESSVVTRAGAIALLVESDPALQARAAWYREHMPPVALFSDVQQQLWYAPYIETAFERGIVRGDAKGNFRPGSILTSHEAAMLLSRTWLQRSPLMLLQWSKGMSYTPTLQDVASSYGMRTPVGVRPMPKSEFLRLLQEIYGETAVASLPAASQQWTGHAFAVTTSPSSTVAALPGDAPLISRPAANMTPRSIPAADARPVIRPSPAPSLVITAAAATDAFTISLPTLGIQSLPVVHPNNPFTHQGLLEPLKNGVGHLFSYPGRGGKILIYGHSSSYAWDVSPFTKIFRRINELAIGDRVNVTYNGLARTYVVREKKAVPAADLTSYQNDGDGEELILYTCWPPDSITQRYLVIAEPVDSVAAR